MEGPAYAGVPYDGSAHEASEQVADQNSRKIRTWCRGLW